MIGDPGPRAPALPRYMLLRDEIGSERTISGQSNCRSLGPIHARCVARSASDGAWPPNHWEMVPKAGHCVVDVPATQPAKKLNSISSGSLQPSRRYTVLISILWELH